MYIIDESNTKQHEYPTYGRQFNTYKWFKPVIFAAVMGAFYVAFGFLLVMLLLGDTESRGLSYADLNFQNIPMTVFILGSVAIAIPAVFIASKIVRDRPFSSYSSARGGWNNKVFIVGLLAAAVTCLLPRLYLTAKSTGFTPENKITALTLLIIIGLGSLQCIAEEYLFRGVLMQTIGSWVKIPALAVLIQAIVFVFPHAYDMYGLLTILVSGIAFGAVAWITRGIEASSALHIMNNVPIFYLVGAGLSGVSGSSNLITIVYTLCVNGVFVLIMLILRMKTHLFDEVRKDDLAVWNETHNN